MWNKETIIGIASILIGNGGAGMLAWFAQTIPALVVSVIFTIGGVVLLVVAFKGKGKSNKLLDNTLKIGAKVKEIETYDYYATAEGRGISGDKKVLLDIILILAKPMVLDIVALQLWGKLFEIKVQREVAPFDLMQLAPITLSETHTYIAISDVSKELAIDTKDARIYALASGSEWFSDPFSINFGR